MIKIQLKNKLKSFKVKTTNNKIKMIPNKKKKALKIAIKKRKRKK